MRPVDALVILNLLIAGAWTVLFYYRHFLNHAVTGHRGEFLSYAFITLGATLLAWRWVRRIALGWVPLGSLQVLVLLHFLGGVMSAEGTRLYDVAVAGSLTYDKLVHLAAGFVAAQLFTSLVGHRRWHLQPFPNLFAVLVALGAGAAWELVEYVVYALIPLAGVGGYDNTMQDLLANLLGATLFVAQPRRWQEALAGLRDCGYPTSSFPEGGCKSG